MRKNKREQNNVQVIFVTFSISSRSKFWIPVMIGVSVLLVALVF